MDRSYIQSKIIFIIFKIKGLPTFLLTFLPPRYLAEVDWNWSCTLSLMGLNFEWPIGFGFGLGLVE